MFFKILIFRGSYKKIGSFLSQTLPLQSHNILPITLSTSHPTGLANLQNGKLKITVFFRNKLYALLITVQRMSQF